MTPCPITADRDEFHASHLRGALAAIIADPDCCAASKAIARSGLAHATASADRIRMLEETLQQIADSGTSMNAYLALRALSDGDIDA